MRRLAWLLVFVASTAHAAAQNEAMIQPDESFPWTCDFHQVITSIVSTTVTLERGGADPNPATVVSGMQVNASNTVQAIWIWTPTGKPSGNVYQVHILAQDADGSRFACDGKLTVKRVQITT